MISFTPSVRSIRTTITISDIIILAVTGVFSRDHPGINIYFAVSGEKKEIRSLGLRSEGNETVEKRYGLRVCVRERVGGREWGRERGREKGGRRGMRVCVCASLGGERL